MKRFVAGLFAVLAAACFTQPRAADSPALVVKPIAQKKIAALPPEPLFWTVQNFPTLALAQSAAGPTSLAVEAAGKAWLFTLGTKGSAPPGGGTKVAEVGPVPHVAAKQYLLRINEASGPPGAVTAIHTHPGSEAFYVLSGETTIRTASGALRVPAGQAAAGHGADVAMRVSSSGTVDLHSLVMFVVDADRPFSSPAAMPQ